MNRPEQHFRARLAALLAGGALVAALFPMAGSVLAAAPVPSAPDLTAASDTGTSSTDNITSDTTPTFVGTAEVGSTVELFADLVSKGTAVANGSGAWSITSTALTAGTYSFTATADDTTGTSAQSPALSVTIDTSVPLAPSAPDLAAASDSGPSNTDNITNVTTPTFTGSAPANSIVELFAGSTSKGTTTANGSGAWTIISTALTPGTYSFTVKASNVAGGTSAASPALSVTIYGPLGVTVNQAAAQADPTGTSPINFTVVFTSPVANFVTGDVSVTGTAGFGVKTATVTGSGTTYNVAVTGMTTAGTVIASVGASVASDAAGNNSAASTSADNTVTWDTTAGPSVTINQAAGQADPTATTPIYFTVVFSAPVTGFDGSDVTLTGTAGATSAVVAGGSSTYSVAVSGMSASGTVIATIAADRAVGITGGHPSLASTSTDNTVTFRIASKFLVTSSNYAPVPGSAVTITAQLADSLNNAVPAAGIVVTWSSTNGGSFSSATSTTNASGIATVTFTVSTTTAVVHTVTATGGGFTGTSPNITVTASPASITLTPSASVITWAKPVVLTVHFGTLGSLRPFTIQVSRDLVTWSTVPAALTTDSNGNATYSYRPATNLYYRVSFAGAADLSAAFSNVPRVVVRQIALLRPTSSGAVRTVSRNTSVTFTTTVRPVRADLAPAKVTFVFYRLLNGRWTFLTKRDVYINSLGLAKYTWKFSWSGSWYVRSIVNPTIANANSVWSPVERYNVN